MNIMAEIAERRRHRRYASVMILVGALGYLAATTQLTLTRELVGTFSGDELTIGLALSCWLVLTAAGTWIGTLAHQRHHPIRLLANGLLALTTYALVALVLIRLGRHGVFLRGTAVDPLGVTATCLLLLAPLCAGNGALLTVACHTLLQEGDTVAIGRIYAADAAGSIVGAAVFTFLFSTRFDHGETLLWTGMIVAAAAAVPAWRRRAYGTVATTLVFAIGFGALARLCPIDAVTTARFYGTDVVAREISPYGRLVVTREAGQLTFYENGTPTVFTANAAQVEEIVHYALCQRPEARSVLLIGGTVSGAATEVLRYPNIQKVVGIEIDPSIIAAGRSLLRENIADDRIRLVLGDARRFVQQTRERFDIMLVALPDPSTFQLNRYYTTEFFSAAKRVLTADGVIAIGCGRYENYVSPELRQLLTSVRASLATSLRHVTVIPGGRVFFLGSDQPLTRDIAGALEVRNLHPMLVNRHYLDATLSPDRLADVDRAVSATAPLNRDFRPVLYLLRLQHWLRQFAFPAGGIATGLGLAVLVAFVRLRPIPRMIFSAGFAGSALEMALLIAVQTLYGSLYQQLGVVVGVFMLGLAVGAAGANRASVVRARRAVRKLGLIVVLIAMALALAIPRLPLLDATVRWPLGYAVILTMTLLLSGAMGAQFSIAAATSASILDRTAPRLFSADLLGAAVGGLAVSAFLLPAFGLSVVCLITAGLNAAAVALSWIRHRDT